MTYLLVLLLWPSLLALISSVPTSSGVPPRSSPVVLAPGLINQGNTCYLNSVIQSLFHVPLFRRRVLRGLETSHHREGEEEGEEDVNTAELTIPEDPSGLGEVFRDMLEKSTVIPNEKQQQQQQQQQRHLPTPLPLLSSTVPLTSSLNLPPSVQFDASEFFTLYLYPLLPPPCRSLFSGSFVNFIEGAGDRNVRREVTEETVGWPVPVVKGGGG